MIAAARPAKPCTLLANVRIERGTRDDWLALARFHYRSHEAGAVTGIFRMVYDTGGVRNAECGMRNEKSESKTATMPDFSLRTVLVGVIVYSRSPLSLGARDRATGGRYRTAGMGRTAAGYLVNRELRIISRVVLAPNWRGLGLASRLVAETLPLAGTPYVEALAAMGEMHPMFQRAGMTAYPQRPAPQGERLRAALEAAGIDRAARRRGADLGRAIDALPAGPRRLVGLTVLLVAGLATILGRVRSRSSRALLAALLAACTWWNLALIVQFGTGLMDRQRLTLGANVYNAFVVVPREIPRIAYRYAFDRKSFYAAPTR
jgi:GNAT superfamily N-acetyltransferase